MVLRRAGGAGQVIRVEQHQLHGAPVALAQHTQLEQLALKIRLKLRALGQRHALAGFNAQQDAAAPPLVMRAHAIAAAVQADVAHQQPRGRSHPVQTHGTPEDGRQRPLDKLRQHLKAPSRKITSQAQG